MMFKQLATRVQRSSTPISSVCEDCSVAHLNLVVIDMEWCYDIVHWVSIEGCDSNAIMEIFEMGYLPLLSE